MISIIIPNRMEENILRTHESIFALYPSFQVITVNDRDSRGKGWALKQGLKFASFDYIAFLDGDMDIHPSELDKLIRRISTCDVVVGKKEISGPWHRKVITYLSRVFIKILFSFDFDTQTGIKIFKSRYLKQWKCNSFAFDLEVLKNAKDMGAVIKEVPIEVSIKKAMPGKSILKFIVDAIRIRYGCI